MKTFKKYLFFNLVLLFFHVFIYFISAMGIGGGTGLEPRKGVFITLLAVAALGASPNLVVLFVALLKREKARENVLWAFFFGCDYSWLYVAFWARDHATFNIEMGNSLCARYANNFAFCMNWRISLLSIGMFIGKLLGNNIHRYNLYFKTCSGHLKTGASGGTGV